MDKKKWNLLDCKTLGEIRLNLLKSGAFNKIIIIKDTIVSPMVF